MKSTVRAALVGVAASLMGNLAHADTISTAAVTLIFEEQNSSGSTFDQTAATGNPNQSRPMQLSSIGSGITGTRNFVFNNLQTHDVAGPSLASPVWTPISQYGPANDPSGFPQQSSLLLAGQQRFSYSFGAADDLSAAPDTLRWVNTFRLVNFGAFYLQGDCPFCGADKPVQLAQALPAFSGTALYQKNGVLDVVPGTTGASPFYLAGNFYDSAVFDIVFGTSGITGTLQFSANSATLSGTSGGVQTSWGRVILSVNATSATEVPEPPVVLLLLAAIAGLWITLSHSRVHPA